MRYPEHNHIKDVDKLKIAAVNMKKLNHVVSEEVVQNAKFNKLSMKVNNVENNIYVAPTTLIHIN